MHLSASFLIITGLLSLGASQLVNLTRNRDLNIITCAGEFVKYTCIAETQLGRVQWIAEPYVTTSDNDRVVENLDGNQGREARIGDVVIQYVSNDPFVTTLTLNGTTATTSTNVTCSTVGLSPDRFLSLPHRADDSPVEPVNILRVVSEDDGRDSNGLEFKVTFNSSPNPHIDYYIVCTDGNCEAIQAGSSDTIMATGSCLDDDACDISVRAVNRCGTKSSSEGQRFIRPIQQVERISLFVADNDGNWFSSRVIVVFTPSPTSNISNYIVNCTDGACNGFVLNGTQCFFSIDVGSSCTGVTYNVSIVAIDEDGRRSRAVTASVDVKEALGYCLVTSLFTVIIGALLIALIGLLIFKLYTKYMSGDGKKNSGEQQSENDETQTKMKLVPHNRVQCDAV